MPARLSTSPLARAPRAARLLAALLVPLAAGWMTLTLGACNDGDPVGLGLVGGEGGNPVGLRSPAATVGVSRLPDLTGGEVLGTATNLRYDGAQQFLAGRADDPALGTFEVTGYADFGGPTAVGGGRVDSFRATRRRLASAELVLSRQYAYGDTLRATTYALRPVTAEFVSTNAPSDTTFATGPVITTFTVAARDTSIRVTLPPTFLVANDTTLRSAKVGTSFHGFALEPVSGGAVYGFAAPRSRLIAIAGADTVQFASIKFVSNVRRVGAAPVLPAGRLLLQDGLPTALDLTLRLDTSKARGQALARAGLVVTVDTLLYRTPPPGFTRGPAPDLELVGIDKDGTEIPLFNGPTRLRAGRFVFLSALLRAEFQRVLLGGTPTYVRYSLRVPRPAGTLGALVVVSEGPDRPAAVLTLVGTD